MLNKTSLLFLFFSITSFADNCFYESEPILHYFNSNCSQAICETKITCIRNGKKTQISTQCLSDLSGACPSKASDCLKDTSISTFTPKTMNQDIPNQPQRRNQNNGIIRY